MAHLQIVGGLGLEKGKSAFELTLQYVPEVGRPGMADADYQVWIDAVKEAEIATTTVKRRWVAQKSSFVFNGLDWQSLPTLHHIVAKLAELTVVEIVEGVLIESRGFRI